MMCTGWNWNIYCIAVCCATRVISRRRGLIAIEGKTVLEIILREWILSRVEVLKMVFYNSLKR
jgi:hypothetical protein